MGIIYLTDWNFGQVMIMARSGKLDRREEISKLYTHPRANPAPKVKNILLLRLS
jgi:hypothetical protein